MKILFVIPKSLEDEGVLDQALDVSAFNMTELVSLGDKRLESWARSKNIKVTKFDIDWGNLDQKGAEVAKNKFGKPYNKNAARFRDELAISYSDACIKVKGEKDFITARVKKEDIPFFEFDPRDYTDDDKVAYVF